MKCPAILNDAYQTDNDGSLSLLFALGSPLVGLVGLALQHDVQNPLLAAGWIGLTLGHIVVAIFFGLSRLASSDRSEASRGDQRAALAGICLSSCTLLAIFVLLPALGRARDAVLSPAFDRGPMDIGIAYAMYAGDHPDGRYPPLSPKPGHLMTPLEEIYPAYLTDMTVLLCSAARSPRLDLPHDSELFDVVSDESFFYLGYLIDGPETLRAFQHAYENIVAAGGNFEADLSVPEGQGTWGGNTIPRLTNRPETLLPGFDPNREEDAVEVRRRTRELPVLIERSGHHDMDRAHPGGTAHVLYLDGHVARLTYPGDWPMTEETMSILRELDKLGPYIPEDTSETPPNGRWALAFFVLSGIPFVLWRFIRHPGVTVPLFYVFTLLALNGLSTFQESVPPGLPVATPDGEVTYHVVEPAPDPKGTTR